jgi:hypothetical protein
MIFLKIGLTAFALTTGWASTCHAAALKIHTKLNTYEFSSLSGSSKNTAEARSQIIVKSIKNGHTKLSINTQLKPTCSTFKTPTIKNDEAGKSVVLFCGSTGPEQHETLIAIRDGNEVAIAFIDAQQVKIPATMESPKHTPIRSIENLSELSEYGNIKASVFYILEDSDATFSFSKKQLGKEEFARIFSKPDATMQIDRKSAIEEYIQINLGINSSDVCKTYYERNQKQNRLSNHEQLKIRSLLQKRVEIQICEDNDGITK